MISERESRRLDALRFPLIVGVVYIHVYGGAVNLASGSLGAAHFGDAYDWITSALSQVIARVAVPLFFVMAGHLYFHDWVPTLESWRDKLRRRVATLLVPYVFWNAVMLLAVLVGQSLPATAGMFSGRMPRLAELGTQGWLAVWAGTTETGAPIAYHLWFIRDLFLLAVLAPVLHVLLRRGPIAAAVLGLLAAVWAAEYWWPLLNAEALLFFTVGAITAMRGVSLFALDRHRLLFTLAFAVLLVLDVVVGTGVNRLLHCAALLAGMPAALAASRWLVTLPRRQAWALYLSSASFFVYAAHEPLLMVIKKLAYLALHPQTVPVALAVYVLAPVATVLLCLAAHHLCARLLPRFTALITGGRQPRSLPPGHAVFAAPRPGAEAGVGAVLPAVQGPHERR